MKKIIILLFSLVLSMFTAFSTPIATNMSTTRDSIASVDSIDFKVSLQIDGQFNDPVISFPQGDDFLEITTGFYDQKLGKLRAFEMLAEEYLDLQYKFNIIQNKSPTKKTLDDMNITIEQYKQSKIRNFLLILISLLVSGLLYIYNLNITHKTFEHMKMFQIGIVQLFFSSITFGVLYLLFSLIFNQIWLLL